MYNSQLTLTLLLLCFFGLANCSTPKTGTATDGKVIVIERDKDDRSPLYVVNGTVLKTQESRKTYLRIKPNYFDDVAILEVDQARKKYGSAGQYRAVEVTLSDSLKAYNDLINKESNYKSDKAAAVPHEPLLIGGLGNFQRNVPYPSSCREAGVQGTVTVSFKVDKQGKTSNPKILRGIHASCDAAVKRAVITKAKFLPALRSGKPVDIQYHIPVFFKLQ